MPASCAGEREGHNKQPQTLAARGNPRRGRASHRRRRILGCDTIAGLDERPPLDLATWDATERIVAMAGIHPYMKLLD
jgi:hypothetical protein